MIIAANIVIIITKNTNNTILLLPTLPMKYW